MPNTVDALNSAKNAIDEEVEPNAPDRVGTEPYRLSNYSFRCSLRTYQSAARSRCGTSKSRRMDVALMTHPIWTRAEWWTAWGTWALVVVTLAAAIIGLSAAYMAKNAYVLESEAVLVMTWLAGFLDEAARNAIPSYIAEYTSADGKEIRLRQRLRNEPFLVPPGQYYEIRNVGRSPAVGITLGISIETETLEGQGEELESRTLYTHDTILIDAVAPQTAYRIGVLNQLPNEMRLTPDAWATQVVWNDKRRTTKGKLKRKPLAVIGLTFTYPPAT